MTHSTIRLALLLSCLLALACNPGSPPPAAEATEAKPGEGDKTAAAAKPEDNTIPAPPDVAAPPADAEKTASLSCDQAADQGTGDTKPAARQLSVHYTGWTTDGKMFDSSVKRGHPRRST